MNTRKLFVCWALVVACSTMFCACECFSGLFEIDKVQEVGLPEGISISVSMAENITVHYNDAKVSGVMLLKGNVEGLPQSFDRNINVYVRYGKDKTYLEESTVCRLDIPDITYDIKIPFSAVLPGLDDGAVYYCSAEAEYGTKDSVESSLVKFFTLPEGPVDLDLESGNLWASANIGAAYPEEYGDYYAWGDTKKPTEKSRFDWSSYMWSAGAYNKLLKYCLVKDTGNNGFVDGKNELDYVDDIAAMLLDGQWQTPSVADFNELIAKCTYERTQINGVYGMLFSSKKEQTNPRKRVFFPYAGYQEGTGWNDQGSTGYYWTNTLCTDMSWTSEYANSFKVDYFGASITYGSRCYGLPVRPVLKK